jgi:hypothetical protein
MGLGLDGENVEELLLIDNDYLIGEGRVVLMPIRHGSGYGVLGQITVEGRGAELFKRCRDPLMFLFSSQYYRILTVQSSNYINFIVSRRFVCKQNNGNQKRRRHRCKLASLLQQCLGF